MTRHNNDIAACEGNGCPMRTTCLRWQLGQQMPDYQWWANFKPEDGQCKYHMYNNTNDNGQRETNK